MRLLRGSGPAGLAGIPPKRDNIVRPLLRVWRREMLAYLAARGLQLLHRCSRIIPPDFLRNRVRLDLLPMLEAEYAPRLRERLANLAELERQDDVVVVRPGGRFLSTFA